MIFSLSLCCLRALYPPGSVRFIDETSRAGRQGLGSVACRGGILVSDTGRCRFEEGVTEQQTQNGFVYGFGYEFQLERGNSERVQVKLR